MEITKGARLSSLPANMGFFFFAVVKLFGNRFDLTKSIKIRSRCKSGRQLSPQLLQV